MKPMSKLTFALIVIIIGSFFYPQNAYAYIDPGSGSLIIQMIVAFAVGAAFAVKMFWFRVKNFFVNLFSAKKKSTEAPTKDAE